MTDSYQTARVPRSRVARRRSTSEITREISAKIGAEFFDSLVKNIGQASNADFVLIGEFAGGPVELVKTLAVFTKGELRDRTDYVLAGSVVAQVTTGDSWSCTRGAAKRFPLDKILAQIGAQACIVVPLLDVKRQALGVMMAAFHHPLSDARVPKSMLELFAPRASTELQRKQADAALRESEQRYHAFIARNADAMWRIEFDAPIPTSLSEDEQIESICRRGYLAECNDAMARLVGRERAEQLIGATLEELTRHADPHLREDLRAAIRSGYRFDTVETKPLDREGRKRHLVRTQWCVVENGNLERIWGTLRDVTELKRTEEALQASERRLSEMLASIHLLTVMLDNEGSIAYCNDYLLGLTGWKAGELAGKNWFDLMVPPEERERLRAEFTSTRLDSGSPKHVESTLLGKDGSRWLIAWESSTLRDPQGRVTGLAAVGRDITSQKAIQDELGQSRKLEKLRRSVDKMLHDFTTLMTIISGYCAILLQDRPDTDPDSMPLMEIRKAAEQGIALTQQLLAFSRERKLQAELLDLNPLIEEVGRSMRCLVPDGVSLQIALDPELGLVRADPAHFRQVLLNLAINAMEAMPEGGVLSLHSSNIELDEDLSRLTGIAPGHYVLLAVADTGSGMSEEIQAHLFEPFFTTKSNRAGLGLSTVHNIVQQSDGHIVVDSKPNIGTTFQIYLPRVET